MGRQPTNFKENNQPLSTGTIYFFGIGINNYQHWPKLNNAVRDVEKISQLLQELYDVKIWKLLRDNQATRKQIIRELNALTKQVQAPDSIIIYYAGHGHLDRETQLGAWIPIDAEKVDTDLYIPNSTLRDFFQVAKAQHVLFISDACFSGSLLQERRSGEQQPLLQELAARPSRWVMCSGRHDEAVADGPRGGHSPFAQAIIDELEHNQQAGISAAAFAQAVQLQCRSYYRDQLPDYGPVFDSGDKRGQLVLWQNGQVPSTISTPPQPKEERYTRDQPQNTIKPVAPMTLTDFKRMVNKYLAEDEPKQALQFMSKALKEETDHQNTVILQLSRVNRLNKEKDGGTISHDNATTKSNQIVVAINSLLSNIETADLRPNVNRVEPAASPRMSEQEKQGIERAIMLKTKIINKLRESLALEDDPTRQIRYETQLQQAEDDLAALQAKLN